MSADFARILRGAEAWPRDSKSVRRITPSESHDEALAQRLAKWIRKTDTIVIQLTQKPFGTLRLLDF